MCKRKETLIILKCAIENYRNSFKFKPSQKSVVEWKCNADSHSQVIKDIKDEKIKDEKQNSSATELNGSDSENGSERLNLSKQAVRVRGEAIFYIKTWNKGLSPSERAKSVSNKLEKIVDGDIDIQGLGIFEHSFENTVNESSPNEKSKVIKIISDSKFLSESDKQIIEVTYQDALLADEEKVADLDRDYLIANLAQDYLTKINKAINKLKKETPIENDRGYSVKFLKEPLFSINSSGGLQWQSSFRASNISNKIEKYSKKYFFSNPDKLVAAYEVGEGEGLCILPESIDQNDFDTFKDNNYPIWKDKNKNDCKVEELVQSGDLYIVYSNEITKKLHRGDWQLTDSKVKRIYSEFLDEELPQVIIYMNLRDNYEDIMSIHYEELDPILHEEFTSKQELAIDFLQKIEKEVNAYVRRRRIWFVICIIFLIAVLQRIFKTSFVVKNVPLALKDFLTISVPNIHKDINKRVKNNHNIFTTFIKFILPFIIIVCALYNIPKIHFWIHDFVGRSSGFLEDRKSLILSYLRTQTPRIIFILVIAIILYRIADIFILYLFRRDKKIRNGNKTKTKENNKIKSEIGITRIKSIRAILRLLLVILTLIFIAPHLPAAGTIYFQGISAFAVVAFTWSAQSIIADFVSGFILMYTKSLNKNEWIEVGDTIGVIKQQNLLFHKIKTPKNFLKTIPNSVILNSCTTNLSKSSQDFKLILHVPVGLGYDLPRDIVETVLIVSAFKTNNVVKNLQKYLPFVLITNLGDFAVTYDLNVYIDDPKHISQIYSDLYKNIQDECESRNIEILSPNYVTMRFDEESSPIRVTKAKY